MAQPDTGAGTAFISYARQDAKFVTRLAADLRRNGVAIWLDQDLKPGQDWPTAIHQALTSCPQFVVVLSRASVASSNVLDEVNLARDTGKRIVPILLEPCEVPFRIRTVQYVDFTGLYEEAFQRLLRVWKNPEGENAPLPEPKLPAYSWTTIMLGLVMVAALAAGVWWVGFRPGPSEPQGGGQKPLVKQKDKGTPPVTAEKQAPRPRPGPPPSVKTNKDTKVGAGTKPEGSRPAEEVAEVPKEVAKDPGERPAPTPPTEERQQPLVVTGCQTAPATAAAPELINIINCMLKKPAQPLLDQVVRQSVVFCQAGPGVAHQTPEQKTSGLRTCLTRLSLTQLSQIERNLRSVYEP